MTPLPIIRTSERSSFKRCPQQWQWGWVEGLRLPEEPFNAATFGSGIHLALAEFYIPGAKRGRDPRETWMQFMQENQKQTIRTLVDGYGPDEDQRAEYENALDLGVVMLTSYLEEYGMDDDWEVIAPEQVFSILIPDPRFTNRAERRAIARFVGTIDLVIRRLSDGKIFILDHKTCHGIPTNFAWLGLDDQATGYQAVATHILREAGKIGPKESVRGMIYNYLRKARPDTRPVNEQGQRTNKPQKKHYLEQLVDIDGWTELDLNKKKLDELDSIAVANYIQVFGDVSKIQPNPLFHREIVERTNAERKTTIRRIGEEVIWMEEVRSGRLPVIKRTSPDCKFCDFFEMCSTDEQGLDIEDYKDMVYTRHDPYADHREGAVNSKTSVTNKITTGVK